MGVVMMSENQIRRQVLHETITAFENQNPASKYYHMAQDNLRKWKETCQPPKRNLEGRCELRIIAGDWGDVTQSLTRETGEIFAVLNMANPYYPGGGYLEGMVAQEENMFRRTDCHFSLDESMLEKIPFEDTLVYKPEIVKLIEGRNGRVYLDTEEFRVCIRGRENRQLDDLGYHWLSDDEIFPFYELRSAAIDMKKSDLEFDQVGMEARIEAQLDTLISANIRHAVLGAFGCGSFANPAEKVARCYLKCLSKRGTEFDLIAFAIWSAGYGRDNFTPFKEVFKEWAF